jgi:putative methionine-R-sulfoxide reductase with GAF domain
MTGRAIPYDHRIPKKYKLFIRKLLRIALCGRCARTGKTLNIADVNAEADHIACSGTTQSEIVVPVFDAKGILRAVLDVDSDSPDAFDEMDQEFLEKVCELFLDEGIQWVNRMGA